MLRLRKFNFDIEKNVLMVFMISDIQILFDQVRLFEMILFFFDISHGKCKLAKGKEMLQLQNIEKNMHFSRKTFVKIEFTKKEQKKLYNNIT